jgi:hypothetical protein
MSEQILSPDDRETLRLLALMLLKAVSSGAPDARFFKISDSIGRVISESVEYSEKEAKRKALAALPQLPFSGVNDLDILMKVAAEEDISVLYFE